MPHSPETPMPVPAAEARKEVPKPVDFGPTDAAAKKKDAMERKLTDVKGHLKGVIDIVTMTPDMAGPMVDAALEGIRRDTGLPKEKARKLLKDALIEMNENLPELHASQEIERAVLKQIERLAEPLSEEGKDDGNEKAA